MGSDIFEGLEVDFDMIHLVFGMKLCMSNGQAEMVAPVGGQREILSLVFPEGVVCSELDFKGVPVLMEVQPVIDDICFVFIS